MDAQTTAFVMGLVGAISGAIATILVQTLRNRMEREKQYREEILEVFKGKPEYIEQTLEKIKSCLSTAVNNRNLRPLRGIDASDLFIDRELARILRPAIDAAHSIDENEERLDRAYRSYERFIEEALERVHSLFIKPDKLVSQAFETPPYQWGPFRLRDVVVAMSTFALVNVLYFAFVIFFFFNFVESMTRILAVIGTLKELFQ